MRSESSARFDALVGCQSFLRCASTVLESKWGESLGGEGDNFSLHNQEPDGEESGPDTTAVGKTLLVVGMVWLDGSASRSMGSGTRRRWWLLRRWVDD